MSKTWFIVIFAFLTCFIQATYAQNISVKSFRMLENDLDARASYPKQDKNGETAALIKIVSTETGFEFDGGIIGIVATVQKTSEIWVYVPRGSKALTIKHPKLGLLRNYAYPMAIEAATVYEMVLVTGKVTTTVTPTTITTQWLLIHSQPSGADVFIDELPAGKTPFQRELPVGKHTYRISLDLYKPQAGVVELIDSKESHLIDLRLQPNFGTLVLNTSPENGADVSIDGIPTGKTTPCLIEKVPIGDHIISFSLNEYATARKQINLQPEQKQELNVQLEPYFANVIINTLPEANIFINDELKASGRWQGRLLPGVYTLSAKKKNHKDATEQLEIVTGQDVEVTLKAIPITGSLKVTTQPHNATVFLDSTLIGKTPLKLSELLIGEHNLKIALEGHATLLKAINIQENQELIVDEQLSNTKLITIECEPKAASLAVNGEPVGNTPKTLPLTYGNNTIQLESPGFSPYKGTIEVTEKQDTYHFSLLSDDAAKIRLSQSKFKTGKYISFASSVAFAAIGTYFWIQSEKHNDEYETATTEATRLHNDIERERTLSQVSYGLSVACLTASWVFHRLQKKAGKQMQLNVSMAPNTASVGIVCNF